MMRKTVLTACALLALTATAHADALRDFEYEFTHFAEGVAYVERMGRSDRKYDDNPNLCRETLETLTKAGVKGTDEVRDAIFVTVPGKAAGLREEDGKAYLPFSKAPLVCDRWEAVNKLASVYDEFDDKKKYTYMTRKGTPEELASLSQFNTEAETWQKQIVLAKACAADVDAALQSGISPDTRVRQIDGQTSLPEYKQKVCEAARTFAEQMITELPAYAKKKHDAIEAKYKKAGIKGKRLELFVYYDMEWYLPGCESSTDDPKQLKKAKKLFQWLTASDGQITIRKFTFKGDNYKISEKTTYSEDKAYKLCR